MKCLVVYANVGFGGQRVFGDGIELLCQLSASKCACIDGWAANGGAIDGEVNSGVFKDGA